MGPRVPRDAGREDAPPDRPRPRDIPRNTNQIASRLGLHYTTVQHHIRFLEEHGVVTSSPKEGYAVLRFLTPQIRRDADFLRTIADRLGVAAVIPANEAGGRILYSAPSYAPPVGVAQPGGASDS